MQVDLFNQWDFQANALEELIFQCGSYNPSYVLFICVSHVVNMTLSCTWQFRK